MQSPGSVVNIFPGRCHSRSAAVESVGESSDRDTGLTVISLSPDKSSITVSPGSLASNSMTAQGDSLKAKQGSEVITVTAESVVDISPQRMRTRSSPLSKGKQLTAVSSSATDSGFTATEFSQGSETVQETADSSQPKLATKRGTRLVAPAPSISPAKGTARTAAAESVHSEDDVSTDSASADQTSPRKTTRRQAAGSESPKAALRTSSRAGVLLGGKTDEPKQTGEASSQPSTLSESETSDATHPPNAASSPRSSTRIGTRRRPASPSDEDSSHNLPASAAKRLKLSDPELVTSSPKETEQPFEASESNGDGCLEQTQELSLHVESFKEQVLKKGETEKADTTADDPRELDLQGTAAGVHTPSARRGRPKAGQKASPNKSSPSSGDPSSAASSETKQESSSSLKQPFVPKYEPIQTRKRTKHPEAYVPVSPPPRKTRLSKGDMLPDVGPRPKAVPKSMLILEPELLPRGYRNKGGKNSSPAKIYATSQVAGPFARTGKQLSSFVGTDTELSTTYVLNADGTLQSEVLTQAQAADGQSEGIAYRVISQPGSGLSDDTPTSLLLLAEAAYPTSTVSDIIPAVTTTDVQPPTQTLSALASQAVTEMQVDTSQETGAGVLTVVETSTTTDSSEVLTVSVSKPETTSTATVQDGTSDSWTCAVCGEVVKLSERRQHLTQHLDEEEEFVCEVCGEQLKDEEDMELHMAVEHDDDGEQEDDGLGDEEKGAGEDGLSEEEQIDDTTTGTYRESPSHTCTECGETFRLAAYLRKHIKEVHGSVQAEFNCESCTKTFMTKTELENHMRLHKTPGSKISFKCVRCDRHFQSAGELSSHAVLCQGKTTGTRGRGRGRRRGGQGRGRGRASAGRETDRHECSQCGKSFSSEVYLKAHTQSKCSSMLQCLYCESQFRKIGELKEHLAGDHPEALPFRCRICQRGFARNSNRLSHEQTHRTEKLFRCDLCGESFTLEVYLKRHMTYRHLKQTKSICTTCGKEFARRADAVKHARVHSGERPYVCEICNHGFNQQSNYKYHMMRHRGEKPHKCPVCGRGFRVPSHLKIHQMQHTDKSIPCTVCYKEFSQERYLQRHMRIHSGHNHPQLAQQPAPQPQRVEIVMNTPTNEQVADAAICTTSDSQHSNTEQVFIEPVESVVGEHVITQTAGPHGVAGESVIEFIINEEGGGHDNRAVKADKETTTIITTASDGYVAKVEGGEVSAAVTEGEGAEEQAYVNADEGSSVVVGAYSEGEGGSVEEGTVTLPFRDLAQLLGGKNYKCDVCSESFGISPNSTYNMIHTGQNHILVVSLNDHVHTSS